MVTLNFCLLRMKLGKHVSGSEHHPSHQTKLATPILRVAICDSQLSVTMRRYLSNELSEGKGLFWRSQSIGQLHYFEATVRQYTMLGGT